MGFWLSRGRGWIGTAVVSLAWVGCGLAGPAAWGQTDTDGAVGGRVLSAVGTPVEGAAVLVLGLETGLAMGARSGANGEFLVARVPVGEYAIEVEDAGVVLTLPGPVVVALGEVTEVEARMRAPVGGTGLLAGADPKEVGPDQLAQLPVDGGQWRSLALTVAGANGAASVDESEGLASYRGLAVTQNGSRVDGGSADQSYGGMAAGAGVEEKADAGVDVTPSGELGAGNGPDGGRRAGAAYTFAQAAVREFRVQGQGDAAAYGSALYGHGVGGVITMASKRGGGELHGMGFYNVRSSAWAAVNPYAVATSYANGVVTSALVRPADLQQQFGGSVGGPVPGLSFAKRSNHGLARMNADSGQGSDQGRGASAVPGLFYFFAFDAQTRDFPAISSPGSAGFYALTATQRALLGNRGVTAAKTNAALNYLDSLTGTVARQANQTVDFGRLDWQGRLGSRLIAEFNRTQWSGPASARSGAVVDRGMASLGSSVGDVYQGVGRWVQFLTLGLSNEVRVQYGRELQYEQAQTALPQEPAVGPGGLPPEVSIGPNGLVFGTPAALGQRAYPDETRLEAADVPAWVRGRHLLQVGVDFSALHDTIASLANVEGTFTYDSGVTGGKAGGLVDWITDYTFNVKAYPNGGCPSIVAASHYFCFHSYAQSFGQQSVAFATQEWAGFVQDDWRVRAGLTVHAGVRYEYQVLPLPQQPNAALDAVFGKVGATGGFPEDRNNFGPRLGLVWEPFGRGHGLLRAGWGAYYGKLPGATIKAALEDTAMANSTTKVRILPTTITACPQMQTVGFGYACSFLAEPSGIVAATTSAVVFDRRFRLPEVQQGTLSMEREVGFGVTLRAGYVVNLDRQLPSSTDINIAPSTGEQMFQLQGGTGATGVKDGETFLVPVYTARVSTSFGPVTDVVSNGNGTYNGLTLEALRRPGAGRMARGLEFRAAWTWSKALDYGQNGGSTPKTNGQLDPFQVRYDKGASALNFPHRIVGTVVWTPRLGSGDQRWVKTVAGGLSLAAIVSEASGRGYSYDISGGTRLAGGHESINGSGGQVVLATVGRNTLRLPDSLNLNARLSRSFRLHGEGLRLRATVEGFNVLNHVNVSGITQRAFLVGTPVAGVTPLVFQNAATIATEGLNALPFGAYTGAATNQSRERQIQMGMRVEF
jgi:hypothetical protein